MSENGGISIALDSVPPYLSGQTILGRLIVTCPSGVQSNALTMILHGEVDVKFTDYGQKTPMHYTNHADVFNISQTLLNGVHHLTPGVHTYPFGLTVPYNIPGSVSCSKGYVAYTLQGYLAHPGGTWTASAMVPVHPLYDIRQFPQFKDPFEINTEARVGCCPCFSSPMTLWCSLEKTAFFPGEPIKFRISLENCNMDVDSFWVELIQSFTLQGTTMGFSKTKMDSTTVATVSCDSSGLNNPNKGDYVWEGELVVPMVAPSGLQLSIICMNYFLKTYAVVKGCGACNNPTVMMDVFIGSLPQKDIAAALASQQKN